jgi:hypothetical protein
MAMTHPVGTREIILTQFSAVYYLIPYKPIPFNVAAGKIKATK